MTIDRAGDWWALPLEELASRLQAGTDGLSEEEAQRRLDLFGPTWFDPERR